MIIPGFRKALVAFLFGVITSHSAFAQSADSVSVDSTLRTVSEINLIGNKITKPYIILRELTFRKGDTLNTADIQKIFERCEFNLMNTSLFNSAHITHLVNPDSTIGVYIILAERWYIFPLPIFEVVDRNFNVWWQTKDFSRIVYGGAVVWNNFRGRNETVGAALRLGYTERVNLSYSIPYIDRKQHSGLSLGFAYARNHQTAFRTNKNNIEYYTDEKFFTRKAISGSVLYSYRKGLYITHYFEAGHLHAEVDSSVVKLNPDFFADGKLSEKYSSVRYFYRVDHRDLAVYPLHGTLYDIEVVKHGMPFLKDDIDITYFTSNYRKYWQLAKRWYFAAGLRGKYSLKSFQPYYNTRALGYGGDYLRGYEYYVIDGQSFGLLKTNLKFELLPKHELYVKYIPLKKFATIPYAFYLNAFSDAGYVWDNQFQKNNSLTNSLQYSFGVGIDFVTYYDVVLRLDYSINKFGESGFFLHFSAPI
jgi:outer membrane protein assembly factor BamA